MSAVSQFARTTRNSFRRWLIAVLAIIRIGDLAAWGRALAAFAGFEAFGLVVEHFGLRGVFRDSIAGLNARFGTLGFGIVVLFVVCWIVSVILFHVHANDCVRRNERT
jgi:high-affinity nickel permease